MPSRTTTRRSFLSHTAAALVAGPAAFAAQLRRSAPPAARLRYGMVTYLWGKDVPLPELLAACATAGLEGLELRTQHAHGVEPSLDAAAGRALRERFAAQPVLLLGLGSDERFDSPDAGKLAAAKAATRAFLQLSADLGGSGVKVKPDSFHKDVPHERTIDQIGAALAELAPFAADLGQELRLEVHGTCADPRVIAAIVARADHRAVRVCWNSNPQDLRGPGLATHFALLRPHFGRTMHVPVTDNVDYPLRDLVALAHRSDYDGYLLLETHDAAPVPLAPALARQRERFVAMRDGAAAPPTPPRVRTVTIAPRADDPSLLDVKASDAPFATVRLGAAERTPAVHPLFAPGGGLVVRGFPYAPGPRDATDHPHHRGLWFCHGDVGGHDFWHDERCRIEVREHSIDGATLHFTAEWRAAGTLLATERRTMAFHATDREHRIDTAIELVPHGARLRFGDTKEGAFALRLAPTLTIEGKHGRGRLANAEGLLDGDCWGKRSASVLAEGPLDGRLVRVTMLDDRDNPWHPTWWHARPYGLLAMNPFGQRAFEGPQAPSGERELTPAAPLRFRVRVVIEG